MGKIGGITVPVSPAKLSPWWITRVLSPKQAGLDLGSDTTARRAYKQGYEAGCITNLDLLDQYRDDIESILRIYRA